VALSATSPLTNVRFVKAPALNQSDDNTSVATLVAQILVNVRNRGDAAVREYAMLFDKSELTAFESRPKIVKSN
jgi:sulfopropanediol 3-dehydrogenase